MFLKEKLAAPVQRNGPENHLGPSACVLCIWVCLHLAPSNLMAEAALSLGEETNKNETKN